MTDVFDGGPTGVFNGRQPAAAQRILTVLEAVAHSGPGVTAKELVSMTDVPTPTMYRMLSMLVSDGYLVRVHDLTGFALGSRVTEIVAANENNTRVAALRHIANAARLQVDAAVVGALFVYGRLVLIDPDPVHTVSNITELPRQLHANALGKLLLAFRRELIATVSFERLTRHTHVVPTTLVPELDSIVLSGIALERGESHSDRSAVARAWHGPSGLVEGGISIIWRGDQGPQSNSRFTEYAALLEELCIRSTSPTDLDSHRTYASRPENQR
ncbi:IclR family transcriptional regulator [Rhodococcoides kyotonense]|uniref:DNA-binding transcriptional regulator, IclR family n=1 Tax=Rhodococcoides kyotonense TaxID=398843 RepID=A0A239N1F3_9NOCA|nr:DNA-binding transcriptional regulator, IclR family [Rhodococcus kyotonensis]